METPAIAEFLSKYILYLGKSSLDYADVTHIVNYYTNVVGTSRPELISVENREKLAVYLCTITVNIIESSSAEEFRLKEAFTSFLTNLN